MNIRRPRTPPSLLHWLDFSHASPSACFTLLNTGSSVFIFHIGHCWQELCSCLMTNAMAMTDFLAISGPWAQHSLSGRGFTSSLAQSPEQAHGWHPGEEIKRTRKSLSAWSLERETLAHLPSSHKPSYTPHSIGAKGSQQDFRSNSLLHSLHTPNTTSWMFMLVPQRLGVWMVSFPSMGKMQ